MCNGLIVCFRMWDSLIQMDKPWLVCKGLRGVCLCKIMSVFFHVSLTFLDSSGIGSRDNNLYESSLYHFGVFHCELILKSQITVLIVGLSLIDLNSILIDMFLLLSLVRRPILSRYLIINSIRNCLNHSTYSVVY